MHLQANTNHNLNISLFSPCVHKHFFTACVFIFTFGLWIVLVTLNIFSRLVNNQHLNEYMLVYACVGHLNLEPPVHVKNKCDYIYSRLGSFTRKSFWMGLCVPLKSWNWMLCSGRGSICWCVPPQSFIPPLIIPQPSAAPQWSDTRALCLIQYTHGDDNNRWWIGLQAMEINGQPIKTGPRYVCFESFLSCPTNNKTWILLIIIIYVCMYLEKIEADFLVEDVLKTFLVLSLVSLCIYLSLSLSHCKSLSDCGAFQTPRTVAEIQKDCCNHKLPWLN